MPARALGGRGDGERRSRLPGGGSATVVLNFVLEIVHLSRGKIRTSPLPFFTFVFLLLLFCVFTNRDSKTKHEMEKFSFARDRLEGGGVRCAPRRVRSGRAAAPPAPQKLS